MVATKIFWSGFCHLNHVCFANALISEFQAKDISDSIEKIWNEFTTLYPESYDGKLLMLNSFELEEQLDGEQQCYLFFALSFIRYSTLIGFQKLQKPLQLYGVIGTQVAVFDETEKYILVGKRKLNQYYSPGLLTLPGGMLELGDVYNPKSSLLRELNEEIEINIKNPVIISLLSDHTNYSVIILIKATVNQPFDRNEIFREKENEFDKHELFWLERKMLGKLDTDELMEGLTYFKTLLG